MNNCVGMPVEVVLLYQMKWGIKIFIQMLNERLLLTVLDMMTAKEFSKPQVHSVGKINRRTTL